ncbi:type II secretion system F family protein [Mahella australiensis]|uniref:Type II secretion system F domain protein n=1 Tax=Mahella australiensis (strain DSM 15567 / CIP 107919 / 50-1 BON) TaxID=697281 RepID=F3ZWU0_MAHA5|nr:type II secretion system F family protein [Mahella australiensis]AEE97562.1 Type II secretion system F domain protein [Mahella australiensis 50-1 BON]
MAQILLISFTAAMGGFVLVVLYQSYKAYKKQKLIERLQRQMVAPQAKPFSLLELLGYNKTVDKFRELLRKAGLAKINAEDALLSLTVLSVILFAVLNIAGMGWLSFLLPIGLIIVIPWVLNMIGTSRHNKLNKQFAEAVQDMADRLKLVPNLENGIRETAQITDQPLHGELEKILHKLDTGIGIIPALKDFARDSESTMIDFWVDSIVFAYQMRASVADVCEEVSQKTRTRLKQNNQVATKLSEIKSMMLSIAGIMIALMFMVYSSSPEYLNSFDTLWGKIALIYTVISYAGSTLYILNRTNKEATEI